jgi:drug/metabolite transporter (DMT)-like permease
VVPLMGFAVSTAVLDVYAGNQLQTHDPVAVAAVSFTLVALFFLAFGAARGGISAALRPWRVSRHDVLAINLMTAVCWLATLYALKYLEPALVSVSVFTLEAVFTLPLSPLLRPGTTVLGTEIAVTVGSSALIGVLIWRSFTGDSAVGKIGTAAAAAGVALTVVSALSGTCTVIYAKRLSEAGHSTQSVLAVRFFAIVIAAWGILAVTGDQRFAATFGPSAILAVVGIGLPIYLFQVGVGHTEPITAELISSLSPVFVFAFQFFDPRLSPSPVTVAVIAGIIVLVVIGTVARHRHDVRTSSVHR